MSPKDWLEQFLQRRGMSDPDGRPLYRYRLTGREYATLFKSVETPAVFIGIEAFFRRSKSSHLWSAAFVLYAAEWWRREYGGSSWKWETLIASLVGVQAGKLPSDQRSLIVETGLNYWRREVRVINGNRRYLGTIAIEGGLPLNQLTQAKNDWLSRVFKQVIPKFARLQHTGVEAADLIAACEFVPKTYKNNAEIHAILGEMVTTVAKLKRNHQLHQHDHPVRHLDQAAPSWRDEFPLPIDEEIGKKLLSDLIVTAAKADENLTMPLRCIRRLHDDGSVQLQLELAGFAALADLKIAYTKTIPGRVELDLLDSGGKSRPLGTALKTEYQGKTSLKMPKPPAVIKGESALLGYTIRFKHLSETLKEIPLIGGEPLSDDVPWVFAPRDEQWELVGLASVTTRAKQVRVLYPKAWQCQPGEHQALPTALTDKKLLQASGVIRLVDNDDNTFTIKTAQHHASAYYLLAGKPLPFASLPKETYLGLPELRHAYSETVGSKTLANTLIARPVNSKAPWQPIHPDMQGVYELRHSENGNILFRKQCALLPEGFAVRFRPSPDSLDGTVLLDNVGNAEAVCEASIKHTVTRNDSGYRVDLFAGQQPPSQVRITLHWPGQTQMLALSLPFPARGGQVIDADGNRQEPNQPLYQDQLHGIRLRLFNENPDYKRHLQVDFTLVDSSLESLRDLRFFAKLEKKGAVIELAVIDYLDWIKTLLAVSGNLDSTVQMAIYENGSDLLKVKIARYAYCLQRDLEQGMVGLSQPDHARLPYDTLTGINLKAMRLSQPEQQHIELEAQQSGGVPTGSWLFRPEKREAEPWLIYPTENSTVPLRPILWAVGYEADKPYHTDTDVTTLHSAVKIGPTEARQETVKHVLRQMSRDFSHSGWGYLQELRKHCQHLPLSSLDVWSLAVKDTQVLAALVLKTDTGFIEKLNAELPVFWELLPLADWQVVYSAYQEYLRGIGIDEADLPGLMAKRIDKIAAACPALEVVARLLKQNLCSIADQEIALMGGLPLEQLAAMINGQREELDRRQADSDWPEVLNVELNAQWRQLKPTQQFALELSNIPKHHHAVIILPIVLAASCANSDRPKAGLSDASSIFNLKCLKSFDEDWFNTAFKWALAYLSQQSR